MVKLNILNVDNFLKVVNSCNGAVNMIGPDGSCRNICRSLGAQTQLRESFAANNNKLGLCLQMTEPQDYLDIIYYYIGEN